MGGRAIRVPTGALSEAQTGNDGAQSCPYPLRSSSPLFIIPAAVRVFAVVVILCIWRELLLNRFYAFSRLSIPFCLFCLRMIT